MRPDFPLQRRRSRLALRCCARRRQRTVRVGQGAAVRPHRRGAEIIDNNDDHDADAYTPQHETAGDATTTNHPRTSPNTTIGIPTNTRVPRAPLDIFEPNYAKMMYYLNATRNRAAATTGHTNIRRNEKGQAHQPREVTEPNNEDDMPHPDATPHTMPVEATGPTHMETQHYPKDTSHTTPTHASEPSNEEKQFQSNATPRPTPSDVTEPDNAQPKFHPHTTALEARLDLWGNTKTHLCV